MAVSGYSDYRRSLHRRNDSDELDVFEAAGYFSGYNDVISAEYNAITSQKIVRDQDRQSNPNNTSSNSFATTAHDLYVAPKSHGLEKHQQMKEILKKHRQPSSPGGRLASFLNSIFSQSASKKKKPSAKSSSSSAAQSMKGEEYDVDGWRRRRRSSISHFRSSSTTTTATTTTADSKSLYSSSSSGFQTPPPYITTPVLSKSYTDLRSYSDHKQVNLNLRSALSQNDASFHKKRSMEKYRGLGKYGGTEERETGFRKFSDDDDEGADSDSSSDLFELQNYDLGFYPSGLPVYETTHIESIKRGTSISNAA